MAKFWTTTRNGVSAIGAHLGALLVELVAGITTDLS